jgi:hypothetical protein
MSQATRSKPMIHEIAYLTVWAALAVALGVSGKAKAFDLILPFQAALLLVLVAKVKVKEGLWWQVRLWFPVLAINLTYFWLGDAIPRLREWRADAALCAIDRFFFGDCLAVMVSPHVQGWSRDLLSGAYLLYFPLWVGLLLCAWRRGGKIQTACFSGLALVHALGFAGYALFPAAGPFCYAPLMERLTAAGGWLTEFNSGIVHRGCNGVDVFPSLHTANTIFVLLSSRGFSKKAFHALLLPCFLIISATIGLQYHYSADLVAGATLGALGWWLTTRRAFKEEAAAH